jgi:hypothetical protein
MHAAEIFIKFELDRGQCSAEFYNQHIVPAVESKLIKDVTPSVYVLDNSRNQVVGAIIEFTDGSQYEIRIFNPPDQLHPEIRYNYQSEIRRIQKLFTGA